MFQAYAVHIFTLNQTTVKIVSAAIFALMPNTCIIFPHKVIPLTCKKQTLRIVSLFSSYEKYKQGQTFQIQKENCTCFYHMKCWKINQTILSLEKKQYMKVNTAISQPKFSELKGSYHYIFIVLLLSLHRTNHCSFLCADRSRSPVLESLVSTRHTRSSFLKTGIGLTRDILRQSYRAPFAK